MIGALIFGFLGGVIFMAAIWELSESKTVYGRCCCTCRFHIKDFHHCSTIDRAEFEASDCVCSTPKGWICMPDDMSRAWSGWSEHGLCEMHQKVSP